MLDLDFNIENKTKAPTLSPLLAPSPEGSTRVGTVVQATHTRGTALAMEQAVVQNAGKLMEGVRPASSVVSCQL